LVDDKKFDDPHIVAILRLSGCGVVCTCDEKAIPFLKDKKLYGDGKKPKIYSHEKNRKLLQDTCDEECLH